MGFLIFLLPFLWIIANISGYREAKYSPNWLTFIRESQYTSTGRVLMLTFYLPCLIYDRVVNKDSY